MTPQEFLHYAFPKLHPNRQPYRWQEDLFARIVQGDFPEEITAPTGSGKTSLISLWLTGLAWQARHAPAVTIPRRLVWVVNRRVVVDQATGEANQVRERLGQAAELRDALAALCIDTSELPLAISTLRGEFADNREWVRDPSRPAIIVGTVDMVGSRLLFSGYGDSFRTRAHHAGLLGQDVLLVNDEAHLTPAFASLIRQVAQRTGIPTVRLSATLTSLEQSRYPASFAEDLRQAGEFAKRFTAPKWLRLHEAANNPEAVSKAVELAVENPAPRTIVYVTRPEDAAAIASRLRKRAGDARVLVLTGTQRGDYRDQMTASPVFEDFTASTEPAQPCWLVSTAAGEVGLDVSCTRLITLLETADHLIQRFGRLNRFGETVGEAHLIYVPPKDKQVRERATLGYLHSLPSPQEGVYDVSAKALFEHPPNPDAMTESPPEAPLAGWAIDRWTLTTSGREAKPRVESWLHGKQDNLAETQVAWRADTALLQEKNASAEDLAKALRIQPLRAAELLREPTHQLLRKLKDWPVPPNAVLLRPDGSVQEISNWDYDALAYSTLILPPGSGGLEDGMFTTSVTNGDDLAGMHTRFVARQTDDVFTISDLLDQNAVSSTADPRAFFRSQGFMITFMVDLSGEDADLPEFLIYARKKTETAEGEEVLLDEHGRKVAEYARAITKKLGFDLPLQEAYAWAGLHHDLGKSCRIWRSAMNCPDGPALAKTGRRRTRPKLLGGFRHELASVDLAQGRLHEVCKEFQDLALHLIACHHGYARPFFKASSCGPETQLAAQSHEAAVRFARLQKQYGPWRLAYLEALFRAADWLASETVSPVPEEPQDA